ncbi:hypothetical protein [Corynebacterium liangguodongii]|uniref:hypothetical protein n=1 Tax=Corynebacterium liangguodongii TaxID=2079535 RepID=UPI0011B1DDCA|nr:hypothetical protein [Corynebacterium liangguodongii]
MKKSMIRNFVTKSAGLLPAFVLASFVALGSATFAEAQSKNVEASLNSQVFSGTLIPRVSSPQPYGLKGTITKGALKGVSWVIRETPDMFIDLAGNTLDDAARLAIKKRGGVIADKVDEVAELPDLTHHVVKEKLTYALRPIVGNDLSLMIADVIAWMAL